MTTWEKINDKKELLASYFYNRIQKALMRQVEPVVKNLTTDFAMVLGSVDKLITEKQVKEEFTDLYIHVGLDFKKNASTYIKGFKGFRTKDLSDEVFAQYMAAFSVSEAGARITSITATSREQAKQIIREIIEKGIAEGLTLGDITKLLEKEIPMYMREANKFRSARIARTEILTSSNKASLKVVEDSGYKATKTWLTAPFGMAKTERHNLAPELAVEQTVDVKMPFIVYGESLRFPGDPHGSAGNVINCQCQQLFNIL